MLIISLQNQIHIYSVDTSDFYKKREKKIHKKLCKLYYIKKKLKTKISKLEKNKEKENNEVLLSKLIFCLDTTNKSIIYFKKKLTKMLCSNKNIRKLNTLAINKKNIVSIFESTFTRTIGINTNELSEELIIVQTYFFDVIKDIILDGFIHNGEKYVCFTASAGQIRTKKTVFIKESTLIKHEKTLMCGLTKERINELGGVNINKFLAYLALCNSATDKWNSFDITKTIVVDDMDVVIKDSLVDFIDDKTYEIERKKIDAVITVTDGCGMILPKLSKKNLMVRLPWVKGLLTVFSFDKFIEEANKNGNNYGIIKDIYGVEHDVIKEGIEIIFTKSQFKMHKYYKSWNEYIENFIQYNCQAGKCNEEPDFFSDAKINYQMLQTLTDITDDELNQITFKTKNNILNLCNNKDIMLKVLGVTKGNINKNYIQQALEIYPNLLRDNYCKEIIEQTKSSIVKNGKAAKLNIKGCYTFIIPDMYAFCEKLFLSIENPNGLLKNGEVFCNIYKEPILDCLRSPHLSKEHAVRDNITDEEKRKWFLTNGLYTSIHDLINKILQFDNDGDCSLVVAEEIITKIAKRNMEDVVPLYYNMAKASGWMINNESIYGGLKAAYTGGNIGEISNNITKIWNSGEITEEKLKVIKLLCMENNFTIDYAKTLYKPERPVNIKKLITKYTKGKVPHFFIYAKNKEKSKVEKINDSVVNRLDKIITKPKMKIKISGVGRFDYKMLDKFDTCNVDQNIINLYEKINLKKHSMINNKKDNENYIYVYQDIRNQLLELNSDVYYVVSVLVEYLYNIKKAKNKTTLWESFGDILIENLKLNIKTKYTYCDSCGILIKKTGKRTKYCSDCSKENQLKWQRESMKKNRNK